MQYWPVCICPAGNVNNAGLVLEPFDTIASQVGAVLNGENPLTVQLVVQCPQY